jgi:hypothetical protein
VAELPDGLVGLVGGTVLAAGALLGLYATVRGGRYAYRISSAKERRGALIAAGWLAPALLLTLVAVVVFEPTGRQAARAFLYLMGPLLGLSVVSSLVIGVFRGVTGLRRARRRRGDRSGRGGRADVR